MSIPDWDDYFMQIAKVVSTKSKDCSTKVGSVVVNQFNNIVATGFNGCCRGIDDTVGGRYQHPDKMFFVEHSETNALHAAARIGIPLDGASIYTTKYPCSNCARAIIQCGLRKVITYPSDITNKLWNEHAIHSEQMFSETNVEVKLMTM